MFSPIEVVTQLPNVDVGFEKASLDFKVKALGTERFEAAKDVTAFANGFGGTIIVDAAAGGEFVKKYLPLTPEAASGTQAAQQARRATKIRFRRLPKSPSAWAGHPQQM